MVLLRLVAYVSALPTLFLQCQDPLVIVALPGQSHLPEARLAPS